MHYSAKRGIAISCRPSVCLSVRLSVRPSVTLVDQDHIHWKSRKLIAWTISTAPSLLAAQRPSTYSQGNMGKFWGHYWWGGEKWCTGAQKVAISLKRVKIWWKLLWRAYSIRTHHHQRSFENYHPWTPTPPCSPRFGFATPTQNSTPIAIISGTGEATDSKFVRNICIQHPNKRPLKIFQKKISMGLSKDWTNFVGTPITPGPGKAKNFKFGWKIHGVHLNKKAH